MRKIATVKPDTDQGERLLRDDELDVLRDDELDAVSGGQSCAQGKHYPALVIIS